MYIVIVAFHIHWSFHSDVKEGSCFSSQVPFPIRHLGIDRRIKNPSVSYTLVFVIIKKISDF